MKRYKLILSLLALISAGLLSVNAKTDIVIDDWDDGDGPADVVVDLISAPSAKYADLHLTLTSPDKGAKIMWTLDADVKPEASEGWQTYSAPLYLTEDCTVRFYATLREGVCSSVETFSFVYADHQAAAPELKADEQGALLIMTSSTPGAKIRYTDDGSDPDEKSALYTEPVEITSYLYRARSFAEGMFPSEVTEYMATALTNVVPVPTAAFENKLLTLSCSDAKATVYYTFNETADINAENEWQKYTAPLALTQNCVVRFFGRRDGYTDSDIQSFTFILNNYRAAEPTIERDASGLHIVMETATEGGEIRYTTDDTEPTAESALYTAPILIEGNGTYTAKTFAPGLFESEANRYVVTNMACPAPYALFGQKQFTLMSLDPKADIWYTTIPDATPEKMEDWYYYSGPFELKESCTLRFFTRRTNFNDSDIETLSVNYVDYQMSAPSIERNDRGTHIVMTAQAKDPVTGVIPGDGSDPQKMGPKIRYTTDGSEPTENSTLYEGPVALRQGVTYKAKVFDINYYDSETTEYTVGSSSLPVPVAEFRNFALVLSCSDEDASIWYTLDPEATHEHLDKWTLYKEPIPLTDDCTYRFFAGDDDENASDIQSFVFQKGDYTVAAPTVERSEDGLYVEMETTTPDADIRYTTDGSVPTQESMLYVDPVKIPCNITFKAKAFAEGLYDSDVTEFVITNMAVPVAYASVENKALVLTCSDPEAAIWYTTDAQATQENMKPWTLYTEPVALSENETYHFFTRRENFNDSDIETFVFLKANYQVAIPTIDRSEDGAYIIMSCETEGASIYYTTDGTDPTAKSTLYTEPVVVMGNTAYRAIAVADGLFDSRIADYTVSNMTVMEPYAVFENTMLTLAIGDEKAEIWYSVTPESAEKSVDEWKLYKAPISFHGDCSVRFFGRRAGFNNSEIKTFVLVYADYQAQMPVITVPEESEYFQIATDQENAEIRFTVDGTDPLETSALYSAPVKMQPGINTIKARVFAKGLFPSEITTLVHDNTVGLNEIETGSDLKFVVRNGMAGFDSQASLTLEIYNAAGMKVAVMNLSPGFNPMPTLPAGVYFAGGMKIML